MPLHRRAAPRKSTLAAMSDDSHGADDSIIAEWQLNRREHLRVSLQRYKGVDLIGIRKWFFGDDDSLRPGKDGITLNIKYLPPLADAIAKALAEALARGLVPPTDGGST
jgi:hypothetical protein